MYSLIYKDTYFVWVHKPPVDTNSFLQKFKASFTEMQAIFPELPSKNIQIVTIKC